MLASFAVRAAVERAGIDPALIEDAVLGCGYPEGTTGRNIARQSIIRAGLPISIAGTTVNRFCASGPASHCDCCRPHRRGWRTGHDRRRHGAAGLFEIY
jgi:acetyl-CoA acetyltransferase